MANNNLLASDNFASGSLAAGWSAIATLSECQVVAGSPNVTEANVAGTAAGQNFTGVAWGDNQICEVTVQAWLISETPTLDLNVRKNAATNAGYQAAFDVNAGANRLRVFKSDGTTNTQIGSTVTGFTISAKDVLCFGVFGSALTVYQNGKRLFWGGDATYTGGVAGYAQAVGSGKSLAGLQVSSWRGYNGVQVDGIWTKQGVIMPATAAELANATLGTGYTGFLGMSFGAARILSGNVYRGYYVSGLGLCYAESPDGITWSKYSGNPILTGSYGVDVYFNNGTYYLWTQVAPGNSVPHLFTSSDGLSFADQGATNIPTGYYVGMHIADRIGGTFYGLVAKLDGANGNKPSTYLLTSPDGITWTFQNSGAAVINGTFCGCQISKVGSKYYFWATENQPGQGAAVGPNFDPYETVRYSSSDFLNWTKDTHSLHNFEFFDSLNNNNGGIAACAVIDVNGRAFLYWQGSGNDGSGNQVYQTGLAIAPAPLASIVAGRETADQQTASDNFPGSSLSANWLPVAGTSPLAVAGGTVRASVINTVCMGVYAGTFSPSQYSEITLTVINSPNSANFIIPMVRASTNAQTAYLLNLTGPLGTALTANLQILKKINGVNTVLYVANQVTQQVGDVFRLSVQNGSDGLPVLTVTQNGFVVAQYQDYSNAIPSGGSPGLFIFATSAVADATASLWAGGNANVIPSYDDLTLPYIGCVSLASGDSGGTEFVGHVKVIGSPRAGVPNPYLGNMYVVTAPVGRDDKLLGEVTVVSGPPAGTQGTDSYLGHIAEE